MNKKTKIENLNRELATCTQCRLAETRAHVLCGEGNIDARLMLIAQAPGETEDKEGRMFIGPSGKVLDILFDVSGITREEVYITNLIKCMLPKCRKPKQIEISSCSTYLEREIDLIDPEVLVPLGYYASKYILERYGLSFAQPRKEFMYMYGVLVVAPDNSKKILPIQHPAALLHNASIKNVLIRNYKKLKILLHECKWYASCPMKHFYEAGSLDRKWIELYCNGDWLQCVRYHMEERGEPHPDQMLPDGSIDELLI